MKRFTKIALITAVIMAVFGVACLIGAFSLGMTTQSLLDMIERGKFSFDSNDFNVNFAENEENIYEVDQACKSMDIEFGAGNLNIYYDDVEEIQINAKGITGFEYHVDDMTLYIEGSLARNSGASGYLTVIIPRDKYFEEVDLELGASKAEIHDLAADTVCIEVGAGEAAAYGLDAQSVRAETGVGRVEIWLEGKEEDYNYSVECGIGAVSIGEHSYGGLGTSQKIENPKALKNVDVECGIGEIKLDFVE